MSTVIPAGCSPLATYYNRAKYCYTRNSKIDTITIHCYVAQVTAKQGCDYFADIERTASCNYVVGKDGSIGVSVPEPERSACTSSSANDHRAVTLEVASDTVHPYKVTDEAFNATIKLVADICKRNDIKRLVWSTSKADRTGHLNGCNMTVHRDYANKSCPGDYLYGKHGEIAAAVNKLLFASVSVEAFDIQSTTATSVTSKLKLLDEYAQYTWSYSLTNLQKDTASKSNFSVNSSNKTLSINSLDANTTYSLEVIAKNSAGEEVKSPKILFSTTPDYPEPVTELSTNVDSFDDLNTAKCSISFKQPASWGSSSNTSSHGFRVYTIVNGNKPNMKYSDSLIKIQDTSKVSTTVVLKDLFSAFQLKRGDSIQVGIQPWIKDAHGNKMLEASLVVFSDTFYIPYKVNPVNNVFMSDKDAFSRIVFHKK